MEPFSGFTDSNSRPVPIPVAFFSLIMPQIQDLSELKIILYIFWFLSRQEGDFQYITREDILADEILLESLGGNSVMVLDNGLNNAIMHGIILPGNQFENHGKPNIFFLNNPNGRAGLKAFQDGKWSPDSRNHYLVSLASERPNIFKLYEENIGPLTPMMTDTLKDAETLYKPYWVEDAIRIAVEKNVRNWRYIDAILRSWQEKGRNEIDRRDPEKNRRKYIEGDYADFIQH